MMAFMRGIEYHWHNYLSRTNMCEITRSGEEHFRLLFETLGIPVSGNAWLNNKE